MRTTLEIDPDLLAAAMKESGAATEAEAVLLGLQSLVAAAARRRIAALGGEGGDVEAAPRRRDPSANGAGRGAPALPRGASLEDLRSLAGTLDDQSAREMRAAVEEACEVGVAKPPRSNGLARLAGTWSEEELREFEAAVLSSK
jgi:Arc/MetJ family transcription regulator